MNMSPPRAIDDRNVESVPNVNARIWNSARLNIGCAERRSICAKTNRHVTDAASRISTRGLPHPVAAPPAGRMP